MGLSVYRQKQVLKTVFIVKISVMRMNKDNLDSAMMLLTHQ